MKFDEAIAILGSVQDDYGHGLLEVLEYMRDNPDDFNEHEVRAFRVVFNEMSKLFAPIYSRDRLVKSVDIIGDR